MLRALILAASLWLAACASASDDAVTLPAPLVDQAGVTAGAPLRKAVVAGGCFWGVQGVYQHLKGVKNVLSGYAGGDAANADYESVSSGGTGHAEAVEILYDPAQVSYGQILHVFFSVVHDPTQLNRQGPDTGTQYRSAIFYGSAEEKKIAEAYIAQLSKSGAFRKPIVTRVDSIAGGFHVAEKYHQDYLLNHPNQPYIVINDLPKVRNFQRLFAPLYMSRPVTVAAFKGEVNSAAARGEGRSSAPSSERMSAAPSSAMMQAAPKPASSEGGAMMSAAGTSGPAKTEGPMPALDGATGWLNSKALTRESLKGKVVVVDFWAYSCINCLRTMPYVNAWYQHYKDSGLVILGVHSPEFAFEKDTGNVQAAVKKFDIRYPVVLDSNLAIWKAFNNRFWPAHYFVDAKGQIRGHHFGEGKYARSERVIRQLLMEAGAQNLPDPLDDAAGAGVNAPADTANVASPETYLGYARAENFVSPGGALARDSTRSYTFPRSLTLNQWALAGSWKVASEHARLEGAPGRIAFKFKARDLHLVLGPGTGKPVRFRVTVDGKPPGADAGMDVDAQGNGVVREHRLFNLVRQKGAVSEREFLIEFLEPGVDAYSFTFG